MRTKRIELEGRGGHVAIERQPDGTTMRIDSMVAEPKKDQQAWRTWELPVTISDEELFKVATEVQKRTDGVRGTNSDIHEYFRELQRFQD